MSSGRPVASHMQAHRSKHQANRERAELTMERDKYHFHKGWIEALDFVAGLLGITLEED